MNEVLKQLLVITHISGRRKGVMGKRLQRKQRERRDGLPHRLQACRVRKSHQLPAGWWHVVPVLDRHSIEREGMEVAAQRDDPRGRPKLLLGDPAGLMARNVEPIPAQHLHDRGRHRR